MEVRPGRRLTGKKLPLAALEQSRLSGSPICKAALAAGLGITSEDDLLFGVKFQVGGQVRHTLPTHGAGHRHPAEIKQHKLAYEGLQ